MELLGGLFWNNQDNHREQDGDIVKIPVFDLIYNTAKYNQDFLEDTNANDYHVYIFVKYQNIGGYIFSQFKNIKFNPNNIDQNDNLEIKLNPQVKNYFDGDLTLFIRQISKNNAAFLNDMPNSVNAESYDMLKNGFGFTCLDGKFKGGKLQQVKYTDLQKKEHCIVNMEFKINKESYTQLWTDLLLKRAYLMELNKLNVKNKYITFGGKRLAVNFADGDLLNTNETISFDLGYLLIKLQESGQQIINNFEDKKITVVCFVKSTTLKDREWHFDFEKVQEVLLYNDDLVYISTHDTNWGTIPIVTNGLKIFVLSGDFSKEFKTKQFNSLNDNQKIQLLRENGFVELELHEIVCCEKLTNKKTRIKALFTADFLEKNDIGKSLICHFQKFGYEYIPVEFYKLEEKKNKWERLKGEAIIVQAKPEIVNVATVSIGKQSLFDFLNKNLDCGYNLKLKKFPNCNIEINGIENKAQGEAFINGCLDSQVTEVTIKSSEDIRGLCLKFDNQNNDIDDEFIDEKHIDEVYANTIKNENIKKSNSIKLILQKDEGKRIAFFYENKKTNIQVRINESSTDKDKRKFVVKRDIDGKLKLFARDPDKWRSDLLLSENITITSDYASFTSQKEPLAKQNANDNKIPLEYKINQAKKESQEKYNESSLEYENYINQKDEKK